MAEVVSRIGEEAVDMAEAIIITTKAEATISKTITILIMGRRHRSGRAITMVIGYPFLMALLVLLLYQLITVINI